MSSGTPAYLSIGKKFGKLLVLSISGKNSHRATLVLCQCECGNIKEYQLGNLKSNHTAKNCGCDKSRTHGLTKSYLYNTWNGMIQRCANPKKKHYHGRGIKVCDVWLNSLPAFIEWAECNGYQKGLELDRIDNNGDYTPENCRFVTHGVNSRNKRSNIFFEYNGQRKILIDWIETLNLDYDLVYNRIYRGWDFIKAISTKRDIRFISKPMQPEKQTA